MTENELSNKILGAAITVHRILGPGLLESAYEACLVHELVNQNFCVERQRHLSLTYKEVHLDCGYRLDIVVEDKVIVEVKAVQALHEIHRAQVLSYLKISGYKLGLIINFNELKLVNGFRRVVNNL